MYDHRTILTLKIVHEHKKFSKIVRKNRTRVRFQIVRNTIVRVCRTLPPSYHASRGIFSRNPIARGIFGTKLFNFRKFRTKKLYDHYFGTNTVGLI